jgi:hypothetical protein
MFRVRQSGKFENVLKTLSGGAVAGHGEERPETKKIVFEKFSRKCIFSELCLQKLEKFENVTKRFLESSEISHFCAGAKKAFSFQIPLGGPKSGGPALPGGQAGGPPGRPALCGRHTPGQGQEQKEEKKGEGIAACRYVVVMKE